MPSLWINKLNVNDVWLGYCIYKIVKEDRQLGVLRMVLGKQQRVVATGAVMVRDWVCLKGSGVHLSNIVVSKCVMPPALSKL